MKKLACRLGRHEWTTRVEDGESWEVCAACGKTRRTHLRQGRSMSRPQTGGLQKVAGPLEARRRLAAQAQPTEPDDV